MAKKSPPKTGGQGLFFRQDGGKALDGITLEVGRHMLVMLKDHALAGMPHDFGQAADVSPMLKRHRWERMAQRIRHDTALNTCRATGAMPRRS